MKTAAIVPVKTFANAKTRLELDKSRKEELCRVMLEEILHVLKLSPKIDETIVVTKEQNVADICNKFNAIEIWDEKEEGVNNAISLADKYLLENQFDASVVIPQDIPLIKTQDIDFMFKYVAPPNFAIVVPSHRFDGTNALVRMPVNLMETHYDEDSYKIHMNTAKKYTSNVALVFVKRIMLDIDSNEDIEFIFEQNENSHVSEKIRNVLR